MIDWTLAGSMVLSGMVIVFLALIILIALVTLVGRLLGTTAKPKPKEAPKSQAPALAVHAAVGPLVEQGIGDETVAVISAAVACAMERQAPGAAYAVTGIRRGKEPRPVWGFAGMQQNTRPF